MGADISVLSIRVIRIIRGEIMLPGLDWLFSQLSNMRVSSDPAMPPGLHI